MHWKVYSKNGKRLAISDKVLVKIGKPETVQVKLSPDSIAFSGYIDPDSPNFELKKSGAKMMIYSSSLVEEIIERFSLDFESKTCLTFGDVTFAVKNGYPVAIIKVL